MGAWAVCAEMAIFAGPAFAAGALTSGFEVPFTDDASLVSTGFVVSGELARDVAGVALLRSLSM